jgi:hypothetical protein
MKTRYVPLLLVILPMLLISSATASYASGNLELAGRKATSEDPAESGPAIMELRNTGPAGLKTLFDLYAGEIKTQIANPLAASTPEWQRLGAALDAVSQQKDSYLSGLYWYTDLAQAKASAKATGKPILSLRLLGNLSDEFSCANSRFFRSVLYSNEQVSTALRERFILHWQSVRAVPRVTIDFGDGRKLERTITGNSIHYVLDADGRMIDALPGLYGPEAFLRSLAPAEELSKRLQGMNPETQLTTLINYHRETVKTITANWLADTKAAGGKIPESLLPPSEVKGAPRAIDIAPLAMTKGISEISILRAITKDADALGEVTDEPTWTRIASRHLADSRLDQQSVGLIKRQMQAVWATDKSPLTPDVRLQNLLQKLQLSIALDSVRDEYMLHTKVHAWLASSSARTSLETFTEKVYAELFLTPQSDLWLGLLSPDVYTGLDNGGLPR